MEWTRSRRSIQRINFCVCGAAVFLLLPLMLLTTGEVISRGFFNKPIPGTVELSEYLLATLILLGVAYTHQAKANVAVSFFVTRFPPRFRAFCQVITTSISMLVVGVIAWQGLILGIEERTVSDMLRIPQFPFRLLVAIAGFLLWLELLIDFADSVKDLSRRRQ
jgi:TRAP-type C4-dicarboxylate transport system permease small subunit